MDEDEDEEKVKKQVNDGKKMDKCEIKSISRQTYQRKRSEPMLGINRLEKKRIKGQEKANITVNT